ncbi:hypothetical protein BKA62DRAFT_719609 [Auriculariales sp. MPI-PUGE-AT-0066]|nr:hypothetical protein BKA62DRAFT_719609 [Auriculariales sp. MPI-PUGE-AT-0066]
MGKGKDRKKRRRNVLEHGGNVLEHGDSWDQPILDRTEHYFYEDWTVEMEVQGQRFKVSKLRLSAESPVFATMFELPTETLNETVVLHNDPDEFRDFLWYIHSSHSEFADYLANCSAVKQFRRALNIARIAHFYEAFTAATWAVNQLVALLPKSGAADVETMKKLRSFANRGSDIHAELPGMVQSYWCAEVRSTKDPVRWLLVARDLKDEYLQAYAYFHILFLPDQDLRAESRLTDLDRLRLYVGSANLRRYESDCDCIVMDHSDSCRSYHKHDAPDELASLRPFLKLKDVYGEETIWEIFTRSPIGLTTSL